MRIKQLELVGFKSFVDRTVLTFPERVTAIVGPNGCGKSNVVDALRWVLGEQSPKHLRGSAMEDVIFGGNDRQAPLGMAEVSILLENGCRPVRTAEDPDLDVSTIPAHFRELAEIMVGRRYYRSGESEYFINKTPCRLKDITELFLGTGVGSKAYAIIEQGRVEQLVSAKPEDRRLFIEEAAGTTLYRSRKLAAERKIDRTRENLSRVTDILQELDRQIQYLKRQARRAEQYRVLQQEMRGLDVEIAGFRWRELIWEVAGLLCRRDDAAAEHDRLQQEISLLESAREDAAAAVTAAEASVAQRREALAVLDAERESQQQRLEFVRQEVRERERRWERLGNEERAVQMRDHAVSEESAETERQRAECAQQLLLEENALAAKTGEQERARVMQCAEQDRVDRAKASLVSLVTQMAESRNQIAALGRRREDAQRRRCRLQEQGGALTEQLEAAARDLDTRREEVACLRKRLDDAAGEKERRGAEIRGLAERRRGYERRIGEFRTALVRAHSRLQSLEEIQRSYEGYQRGVRSIMVSDSRAEGVLGVVADVIGIPREHERAVAAALGERLQYVIVREAEEGLGAVANLREQASGRGSFIPLAPRLAPLNGEGLTGTNGNTARLLDLVRVDERYRKVVEALLGEVVLVPDLMSALALWRRNGHSATMVTPEGDVIDTNGVISGGSEPPVEAEILARRRELQELNVYGAGVQREIIELETELAAVESLISEQDGCLAALDRDTHAGTLELVGAEKDIERLEHEQPRLADRLEVLRFEADSISAEEAQAESELGQLRGDLAEQEAEHQAQEQNLQRCRTNLELAIARAEALSAELTTIKIHVAEKRERRNAIVASLERLVASREELAERLRSLRAEKSETEEERASLQESIRNGEQLCAEQASRRVSLQEEVATASAAGNAAAALLVEREQALNSQRARLDEVRTLRNETEIALTEQRLQAKHLAEAIEEKYAVDLAAEAEQQRSAPDEAATDRLQTLRDRIARFGEVNISAIDDLRELEDRAQFLRAQKADLEQSISDLERTIQRLNRASRTRFAETFAQVNEKFQAVFPRLFRGGEARLVLTDEHNLLESGVEIVVRPPGKRLDTVSLLSGGEKALVAVSLIFSLFLINPTPFCFLDEVDAPLDDANIGRFTQMVKEMSEGSQFVVITHNKRTMEVADCLYGVTMQEPGVSSLISVSMR